MHTALLVVIVLIILAGTYILATYNKLVTLKNRVKEAWSDIEYR
jgi:LemA protein